MNTLKKGLKLFGMACGGFVVLLAIVIAVATSGDDKQKAAPQQEAVRETINVGEEVFIKSTTPEVFLGVTEASQGSLVKAFMAGDNYGVAELIQQGKAFYVSNGTKVLLLDRTFALRKVRILEGENVGKSGWLPFEWLSKTK